MICTAISLYTYTSITEISKLVCSFVGLSHLLQAFCIIAMEKTLRLHSSKEQD